MVRTSTAEKNNYRCPACGDELKKDNAGKGYVAHVSNPHCLFEKGERDLVDTLGADRVVLRPALAAQEPVDGVRVCGYSERGIINALFYEIGFSRDPVGALAGFLSLIHVPGVAKEFSVIHGAEVLLEQSLSDFGTSDAILLLHGSDRRCTLFIEGKVKSSQSGQWTVNDEWSKFLARENGKLNSSNLFTQLYHKVRFVAALREGGIAMADRGVPFPPCSTKQLRKLGDNPVVKRAAQLIETYAADALYILVVPDSSDNLSEFFASKLKDGPAHDIVGWNTAGWGYLSWEKVEQYCREQSLENTVRVFDFNRGQIY